MQLRLVVAEVVSRFDIAFAKPDAGPEFIDNVKDRFTWKLSQLNLRFTPV